jgi:hypothetical protein
MRDTLLHFNLTKLEKQISVIKTAQVLGLLFIVGLAARLLNFFGNTLWQDEVATYLQVHTGNYGYTADPVLYPKILQIMSSWTNWNTPDGLRFFTVIIASFLPLTCYYMGKAIGGKRLGLYCALIAIAHPFMIAFSQQVRPYALFMTVTPLFIAASYRVITHHTGLVQLFLTTFLISNAHPLSVQLIFGFVVAIVIIEFLDSHPNIRKIFQRDRVIRLGGTLTCAILPMLCGIFWVFDRWEKIQSTGAIGGVSSEGLGAFLVFMSKGLPLGASDPARNLAGLILVVLGIWFLANKNRKAFIFIVSAILSVVTINYLTIGPRHAWGYLIFRYFSHLFVICILLMGLGTIFVQDTILPRYFKNRTITKLIGICLLLFAIALGYDNRQFRELGTARYSNLPNLALALAKEHQVYSGFTRQKITLHRHVMTMLLVDPNNEFEVFTQSGPIIEKYQLDTSGYPSPPLLVKQQSTLPTGKILLMWEKSCEGLKSAYKNHTFTEVARVSRYLICNVKPRIVN